MVQTFVSGILRIPFLAALTTTVQGAIGIDTTSGQLRWNYDGTNTNVALTEWEKSFQISTSTLAYKGAFGTAGTTSNIRLYQPKRAQTLTDIYCQGNGATSTMRIGNGSATTTIICGKDIVANSSGLSTAFAARSSLWLDAGTLVGTTGDSFTLTLTGTMDAN